MFYIYKGLCITFTFISDTSARIMYDDLTGLVVAAVIIAIIVFILVVSVSCYCWRYVYNYYWWCLFRVTAGGMSITITGGVCFV